MSEVNGFPSPEILDRRIYKHRLYELVAPSLANLRELACTQCGCEFPLGVTSRNCPNDRCGAEWVQIVVGDPEPMDSAGIRKKSRDDPQDPRLPLPDLPIIFASVAKLDHYIPSMYAIKVRHTKWVETIDPQSEYL